MYLFTVPLKQNVIQDVRNLILFWRYSNLRAIYSWKSVSNYLLNIRSSDNIRNLIGYKWRQTFMFTNAKKNYGVKISTTF